MAQVDIIVPLFNKERTVARTIESIRAQTFADWRLIVVNDGSTDNGPAVVQSFEDSRIVLLHQPNAGPGAARNAGVKYANAEYIAFLDADDQWYPWYLQNAVSAIQQNPVRLVGSYFYEWPKQTDLTGHWQRRGVKPGVYEISAGMTAQQVEAFVFFFFVGATLVHRETALRYGGFYEERCTAGEDTIFLSRMILNERFMVIGPAAMRFNRQDSGLSVTHDYPLNPALMDPEIVLRYCPHERKAIARLFLVRWALLTAHHKARNGFKDQALWLLEHFPEARQFRFEYVRCRIEIFLSRGLPYWVKFKRKTGPAGRRLLKTMAVRVGLAKKPPEIN